MKIRIRWYEIILGLFFYVIFMGGTFFALDQWIMPKIVRKGAVKEIPDVIGENVSKADSILKTYGFETSVAGTIPSELPKNSVVSTEPSPGKVVKLGRTIKIFLSDGSLEGEGKEESNPPKPRLP